MRSFPLGLLGLSLVASAAIAQDGPWSIDPRPALVLGDASRDDAVLFGGGLVGATRLPDGRILVGDRDEYSLKVFDATGRLVKSLGRKGSGPGEIIYLSDLWRCGSDIVAYDIDNGYRVTVFSTALALKRSFQFAAPTGQQTPYASACNATGTFAHFGWEDHKAMKPRVFRSGVPLWLSGIDSTMKPVGTIPGSERWGLVVDGVFRGTRPLPLGKQPVIATGPDRFYTGAADTYEIVMRDFNGKLLGTFGKPGVKLATTKADIDLAIEIETAGRGDNVRDRIRTTFDGMDLPKTIPAYNAMLVDSESDVWVRDYPRGSSGTSTWTVFTRDGKQIAEVQLAINLTVTEIGRDYVLGKYMDPDEDIPQIRMYRLRRQ
jgi:hypothetical protein